MAADHPLSIVLPSAHHLSLSVPSHPLSTPSFQSYIGTQPGGVCGLEVVARACRACSGRAHNLQHVPSRRCCSAQLGDSASSPSSSRSISPVRCAAAPQRRQRPCTTLLHAAAAAAQRPGPAESVPSLPAGSAAPRSCYLLAAARMQSGYFIAADLPPVVQLPGCGTCAHSAVKCSLQQRQPARAAPHLAAAYGSSLLTDLFHARYTSHMHHLCLNSPPDCCVPTEHEYLLAHLSPHRCSAAVNALRPQ